MQTRHRIPTIFNLSMVDVLCCALGCVILLWLINFREAKRRAVAAGETTKLLSASRGDLASARKDLAALGKKYGEANQSLARLRQELAYAQEELNSTRTRHTGVMSALAQVRQDLDAAKKKETDAQASLVLSQSQRAALAKELTARTTQLATLNSRVENLNGQLVASEELIKRLRKAEAKLQLKTRDLGDKLATVDARVLALSREVDKGKMALSDADRRILTLLAERAALDKKLTASGKEADRRLLELLAEKTLLEQKLALSAKDLAGTKLNVAELEAGNRALRERLRLARVASENRFAGLELTGKKVVFLIDVSGSMKMRDENTASPMKWPAVCDTVGKVMKSLPELTHYQIILFSDSVRYLHGTSGRWLEFEAARSPTATVQALKEFDPKGGTRMSPAFAEAFKFRARGMDTIYLISDGLPNDDDNLSDEIANLEEGPRTVYLSNRVRHLLKTVWNRPGQPGPPVRINTIGFFFDSPEVGAFLWALAREHDGGFVGMSRP
jgi:septal ring factor EnvC (AmiA/AmiB activator)